MYFELANEKSDFSAWHLWLMTATYDRGQGCDMKFWYQARFLTLPPWNSCSICTALQRELNFPPTVGVEVIEIQAQVISLASVPLTPIISPELEPRLQPKPTWALGDLNYSELWHFKIIPIFSWSAKPKNAFKMFVFHFFDTALCFWREKWL